MGVFESNSFSFWVTFFQLVCHRSKDKSLLTPKMHIRHYAGPIGVMQQFHWHTDTTVMVAFFLANNFSYWTTNIPSVALGDICAGMSYQTYATSAIVYCSIEKGYSIYILFHPSWMILNNVTNLHLDNGNKYEILLICRSMAFEVIGKMWPFIVCCVVIMRSDAWFIGLNNTADITINIASQ